MATSGVEEAWSFVCSGVINREGAEGADASLNSGGEDRGSKLSTPSSGNPSGNNPAFHSQSTSRCRRSRRSYLNKRLNR